jgi:XTP/dITP diphosphohydrolase
LSREKIVLATRNRGKIREIKRALVELTVAVLSLEDIGTAKNVEETGRTFRENARLKAIAYSLESDCLTLAEDSGLEVGRLEGAPGVFSARFSAPGATDKKNVLKVLRLMKGVPWEERGARFVCHLVLARRGNVIKDVRGVVRGRVALAPRGDKGFGYDPIFYYAPLRRMFGELAADVKNRVSHRGRALAKMGTFLSAWLGRPAAGRKSGRRGPGPLRP